MQQKMSIAISINSLALFQSTPFSIDPACSLYTIIPKNSYKQEPNQAMSMGNMREKCMNNLMWIMIA